MAKTEDEIIHTAMQSWRDRDKTNEFWFKSLIQGAWRSGYTNARNELHGAFESATEAEKTIAYHRGLEDAWEAAKAYCVDMSYETAVECFGENMVEDNYAFFSTAPEVIIEKIKEYDERKKDEIRFGDEVEAWDTNSWVQFIAIGDEGDGWMVGFDRGGGSYRYPVESCRKTGKRWKVIKDGE